VIPSVRAHSASRSTSSVPTPAPLPTISDPDRRFGHLGAHPHEARNAGAGAGAVAYCEQSLVVVLVHLGQVGQLPLVQRTLWP
jgi:hypothetical protein